MKRSISLFIARETDKGTRSPPSLLWVIVKGVWREDTFRLIGDCLGGTVEVDGRT